MTPVFVPLGSGFSGNPGKHTIGFVSHLVGRKPSGGFDKIPTLSGAATWGDPVGLVNRGLSLSKGLGSKINWLR